MRYLMAIGGLLSAIAAVAAIWLLLPRVEPGGSGALAQASPDAPAEVEPEGGDGSLRVCNQTTNPVSIALGYRADRGWQSEGWWVAQPGDCKTVFSGDLDARYYYLYAADDISGDTWDGKNYMCTRDETFTIFGVEDCLARGYERTGFFEVDTQNRNNWMLQLTEGEVLGAEPVDGMDIGEPLEGELAPAEDAEPLHDDTGAEGATTQ